MSIAEEQIDLIAVLRSALRFWRRALVTFLALMSLVIIALMLFPRTYESSAKLFVRMGRETVNLDPTATTGQTVQIVESRDREIKSVLELLKSRNLLEATVDRLGAAAILNEPASHVYGGPTDWSWITERYSPGALLQSVFPKADAEPISAAQQRSVSETHQREKAIRALFGSLGFESAKNSNVIDVVCTGRSPEFAQRKLQEFLDSYATQHLKVNRTAGSYDFFDEQSKKLKEELDAATTKLREAKNQVGLVSIDSQRSVVERETVNLEELLIDSKARLASSQAKLSALGKKLAKSPAANDLEAASGLTADGIDAMREKLYILQIEEQQVISKFTPEHPQAIAIRGQVKEVEELLFRQEYIVERSTMLELQAKVSAIEKQYSEAKTRLQRLNEDEVQVADLQRHVTRLETSYQSYMDNREQARIGQALETGRISNVNIAQQPTFVPKPANPKPTLTLMLGFVLATASAVGVAVASVRTDTSLRTERDVESLLGLPVLMSIPRLQSSGEFIT